MKSGKRFLALFLGVILLICNYSNAKTQYEEKDNYRDNIIEEIDMSTALSIGLLFVTATIDEYTWDESTQIRFIRPLFAYDGVIKNYYIGLTTKETQLAYIIVSADPEKPLITEFSDNGTMFVRCDRNSDERIEISRIPDEEHIYYDSLICATYPVRMKDVDEKYKTNTKEVYKSIANKVIGFIREENIELLTRDSCYYGFTINPVSYLQGLYPNSYIVANTPNIISGYFYPYYIDIKNGCVVYATACILHHYLSSTQTFSSVLSSCIYTAQYYGYAQCPNGIWDYYIGLGQTAPFVKKCISTLNISKTASSSLWFSQARNEIVNGRPCILNIGYYNSVEVDHAVVGYGLIKYTVTTDENDVNQVYFYKILDGDCGSQARYACEDAISWFFVTKIY